MGNPERESLFPSMDSTGAKILFSVKDYDLAATLQSGQAFRWIWTGQGWEGVVGRRWVRLRQVENGLEAVTSEAVSDWAWLKHYLQIDLDLAAVLDSFPQDDSLRLAVSHARGLRLLRQDPWECLASFILSSTKRIVQIQQIIALLCERYGELVPAAEGGSTWRTFPTAETLATCQESDLRDCKMGFRAPGLLETSRRIARGRPVLAELSRGDVEAARAVLMELPGVGRKIADCVLLFAYGYEQAFPVDVWVAKALRELYFPRRRPSPQRLDQFIRAYFGPHSGYAQQYLFHYMRTRDKLPPVTPPPPSES